MVVPHFRRDWARVTRIEIDYPQLLELLLLGCLVLHPIEAGGYLFTLLFLDWLLVLSLDGNLDLL